MHFKIPIDAAAASFPPAVRSRGKTYYRAGRVRIKNSTDDLLEAVVRGTTRYSVTLRIGASSIGAECDCPHAETGEPCKHLWASILAAESSGFFYRVGGLVSRKGSGSPSAAPAQRKAAKSAPPSDAGLSWQEPLQKMERAEGRELHRHKPDSWVDAEELWFIFDATAAPATSIGIVLAARAVQSDGTRGAFRPLHPNRDLLDCLPREEDREHIALLLGSAQQESLSIYSRTVPPDFDNALGRGRTAARTRADGVLQLSGPQFRSLAPRLSATGRLVAARGGAKYSFVPVRWSEEPAWELWIELAQSDFRSLDSGETETDTGPTTRVFELAASLRRDGERREVGSLDYLSNAGVLLTQDGTIVSVDTQGGAAWVELIRQQPIRISAGQVDEFLETVYRMRSVPRLEVPDDIAWRIGDGRFQPVLRIESVSSPYFVEDVEESRTVPSGRARSRGLDPQARDRSSDLNLPHWEPPLHAVVLFHYDDIEITADDPQRACIDRAMRRVIRRAPAFEQEARSTLVRLGFSFAAGSAPAHCQILAEVFPLAVRDLLDRGWRVEAQGRIYRRATSVRMQIASGTNWFDLSGHAVFGEKGNDPGNGRARDTDPSAPQFPFDRAHGLTDEEQTYSVDAAPPEPDPSSSMDLDGVGATSASLLAMLEALRRGRRTILLGDGSIGLLPEEWLEQQGIFLELGKINGDSIRFRPGQASVLDALLESRPEIRTDAIFDQARRELQNFRGITPLDAPAGFGGQLREYQREALGWFEFLQRFGLGGCLADDMGLGKTVVLLAWLELRRQARASLRKHLHGESHLPRESHLHVPSLIVVPRSLVFNWKAEAKRFTPSLRILDHSGAGRALAGKLDDIDVVLTTYGTLRRDIEDLSQREFDYVILDEAQAIKNASTAASKAVRLLSARHRLALSGTPIENHLGELWSLYEFLNPGLLGPQSAMRELMSLSENAMNARLPGQPHDGAPILSRAIRPLLLRRTKAQVAPELPPRSEQVLTCELEGKQRKLYDDLRRHYQRSLLAMVDRKGLAGTKIQVLEALLRLRQAACHPGLLASGSELDPSAKFEVLLPRIDELLEEGHKALVFSQFTTFLGFLRRELDQRGIAYEYLDGQTRDRATRVQRFQESNAAGVFLISLKAGGVGLNLTAADYVFLLDPWWNPAIEAQAIDRTHRIGQTRSVLAYRLIAENTVEEKILELQATKRALADAVLGSDRSLLQDLRREDLEMLLS